MSKIYGCFKTLYLITRYGLKEAKKIKAEKLKDEWHRRYKARLIENGVDEKFAQETLEAGMGGVMEGDGYDYDEDPEDMADSEMSYWEE